jgi:hypothetical protein
VVICDIVIAELPEFVTISDRAFVVEICTVPKFSVVGLAVREPAFVVPVPSI